MFRIQILHWIYKEVNKYILKILHFNVMWSGLYFTRWGLVNQPVRVGICLIWQANIKLQMNLQPNAVEFDWSTTKRIEKSFLSMTLELVEL